MAQIGTLGEVVFEVSDKTIKTFSDYSRKTSSRLTTHDIIGQKPVTEFLGPGADSISFNIKLSAFFGINPKEEADKLRKMVQSGEAVEFIVADAPVSDCKWNIGSLDEAVTAHDKKGNIIKSDISLTLHEYPERREGVGRN